MIPKSVMSAVIRYAVLLLFTLVFLLPVAMMLSGSLKPNEQVLRDMGSLAGYLPLQADWQNYADVFARVPFMHYLMNSFFISACVVFCGLLINSLAGYAFARLQWQGRDTLFLGVIALMIIPLEAIAVPMFYEVTLMGWRDTYLVQIIPFIANAFSIYLFYTFFLGLPQEFEEAARIDSAGPLQIFFIIIVPNAKPVFATVAILTFLTQWGSFLWPLMVTQSEAVRPLPLGIATFYTLPPLQWGDIFAFGVMMVAPVLLLFAIFQRWFVKGVATTGVKG